MVQNGKGLKSTSLRPKGREAVDWTGRNPKSRWHPYAGDIAEHIDFVRQCWQQGEMGMLEEYADVLRESGYSPPVVQSILSQGTQGLPG